MSILKRSLSLLLVAIMLCNMMPLTVLAEEVTPGSESSVQGNLTEQPEEGNQNPQEPQNPVEPEQPEKEEEKPDEPVVEEPSAVEVVQGMINALVIPNTDDYDSAAKYEAALAGLEAQLDAIVEAAEGLSETELEQLNIAKYSNAVSAINDYYIAKIPYAIAEMIDGVLTFEALDGQITNETLYSGFKAQWGDPALGIGDYGYKYNNVTIRLASDSNSATYTHGTEFDVQKTVKSGWGTKWETKGKAKILTYHNFSVSTETYDASGAKIDNLQEAAISATKAYKDESIVLTVPVVEGYNASVTVNNTALTMEGTTAEIAADASKTIVVRYDSAAAATYKVNLTVNGAGTASVNDDEAIKGTEIVVTATPNDTNGADGSVDYLKSITVNGTAIAGTTFTLEADAEVVVTFGTRSITANAAMIYMNSSLDKKDEYVENLIPANMDYTLSGEGDQSTVKLQVYANWGLTQSYSDVSSLWNTHCDIPAAKKVKLIWPAEGNLPEVSLEGISAEILDSYRKVTYMDGETALSTVDTELNAVYTVATPSNATKEGHTLSGWNTAADGSGTSYADGDTIAITENVTLYAQWTADTYTITWVNGDGTTLAEKTAAYGAAVPAYEGAAPTKASTVDTVYTFDKWDAPETVTGNVTIKPLFTEAVREYTISWDTNGDGTADTTTQVAYGTVPTAPAYAELEGKSFAGWEPALAEVTGDAAYKATYSDDTIYTITFIGGEDNAVVEILYINVTKGETIRLTDKVPTMTGYLFDSWGIDTALIGTAPKENMVIMADWAPDVNENGVKDALETAYVKVTIEGNGSVALSGGDKTVITPAQSANYDYKVLWDSKVEGTNVVTVTATPTDTVNTDGSVDYLISAPATVTLTSNTPDNMEPQLIEAKFGTNAITVAETGVIRIDTSDKLDGLKNKVLTAAGIDTADAANYTVYAIGSIATYDVETTNTLEKLALAALLNVDATVTFRIQKNGEHTVSDTIAITIKDIRPQIEITVPALVEIAEKAEPENLKETIKSQITIKAIMDESVEGAFTMVQVSDSFIDWGNLAWPADGQEATFTVTVEVETDAVNRGDKATFPVKLTDTTILYTVTYLDGYNTENNVVETFTIAEGLPVERPEDPSRDYYTFMGWDVEPSGVVNDNLTYTATWQIDNDANGNTIPDETEKYTVVYILDNGQEPYSVSDLAWGAATPTIENPTWEGYNFQGWDIAPAATVTAPASGNTITYTAQWTQNHAVIFMNNGEQYNSAEVEDGELVAEPEVPAWNEDHDFLGWYNGDVKYDFTQPVTESLTLTAEWMDDFNHNDINDATEAHFTITYDVDGTLTTFENVLVGLSTPAVEDPEKADYQFDGWTPSVAETVTADATYVAQWYKDTNDNEVQDEDETILVEIVGEGSASVNGEITASYVYDSTGNKVITIKAIPVVENGLSKTFVKSISVGEIAVVAEDAPAIKYEDDFSATFTFTADGSQKVVVEFADAGFVYNEERLMNYYPGMKNVSNEAVYNTIVADPALPGDFTVTYFARPASSATVSLLGLGLGNTLEGLLKLAGWDSFTINLEELWLDVNVEDMSALIQESDDLNTAVQKNLNADKIKELSEIFNRGNIGAVITELSNIIQDITDSAMYYGAHNFGYNADPDNDTVTERIKITYKSADRSITGESTIDLKDLRAPSKISGSNVTVAYKDYTDEDLIEKIGAYVTDIDNNVIEGAVATSIMLTENTMEGKPAANNPYEVTFKFAGNEIYKTSEATFTVTVTKAGVKYDAPNMTVAAGSNYSMLSAENFTMGTQYGSASEVANSMIQFVLGLNVANLAVDAEGNVSGLNGKVQIILPDELKNILDMIQGITGGNVEEGIELSLSDLLKYLEMIPDTSLDFLDQILNAISGISQAGELKITLGGTLPKDVGAYLYGAVSTSSNYETAFDVSYILVKPNANQVYLNWNNTETNGVYTYDMVKALGLGASAFDDAAFTVKNDYATNKINNLVFGLVSTGINSETKEPTFDLKLALYDAYGSNTAKIEEDLPIGAYTQMAFIGDFGNDMVYGLPIVRAFLLVPDTADVEIADAADTNKAVFDNEAQTLDVSVSLNGVELDKQHLTVYYSGVQTNTQTYHSTTAPVHAGAYMVSAIYLQKDGENIVAMGADVEPLLIEPAASTVEVTDKTVEVKAGTTYPVADMITAQSAVAGVNPDVTVITANVSVSLDGTSIAGGLNLDLPKWVDELLKEKNLLQDKNINVEDMLSGLERLEKAAAELGVDVQIVEGLKSLLADMPAEMKITMNDNVAPEEVGVYLVAAVVTDSDHYPSLDAGLLIIKPQHEQVTLDWNFVDSNDNDIFLLETIKKMDMGAHAVEDAALDPTELFLGVDTNNWKILLTQDKNKLTLGTYTEVAFLLSADGQKVSMAAPISRTFLIVPGTADVTFVDENGIENNDRLYTYDGKSHGIGKVLFDGKELTENCTLHLVYTGVDMLGNLYSSETAPVNAGAYTATAIVTEVDENGTYLRGGAATGALVIQQADLALDMKDTEVTYDGKEHFVDVTSNDETADYLTIIVDKQANIVNIVLEDDATILGAALKAKLEEALGKTLDNEFDFTQFQTALHKVIDGIEAIQIPAEVKAIISKLPPKMQEVLKQQEKEFETRKAALDTVLAAIQKEIPLSGKVVFNGQLPVNAGTYQFYGVALSANYHPEATQGVLTIKPAEVTVTMNNVTVAVGDALPATWTYAVDPAAQETVVLVENAATNAKDTATAGIYDITATAASTDSNYVVTLIPGKLTVVAITAAPDSVELEVGESETITITTSQAGAKVTGAASADETVATVTVDQDGNVVITAVGAGTIEVTVTITAEDGTELTKTIPVTVKTPYYPVNNLTPNSQVEINGKTYPVDENGIAWISEEDYNNLNKQTHVIATSYDYSNSGSVDPLDPQNTKGHQTYGTSMTVWYLVKNSDGSYTATEITELADFLTYQGTSIRWSSDLNMKNGIRVFTALSEAERQQLINGLLISHPALKGAKLVEYGTIITSKDKNETLVYGGSDVFASYAFRSAINEDRIFSNVNGTISYTGSFVELNEETAKKELLIRPYMILQLPDGQQITVHGAILQRSVAYVAYQNKDTYAPGTAAYEFILNLIKDDYSSFLQ